MGCLTIKDIKLLTYYLGSTVPQKLTTLILAYCKLPFDIHAGIQITLCLSGLMNWDIDAQEAEYEDVLKAVTAAEVKEIGLGEYV